MRSGRGSNPLSQAVHWVDRVTSRPATAVVVIVLVLLLGVTLAIAGQGICRAQRRTSTPNS
jgi:hypothetical protein